MKHRILIVDDDPFDLDAISFLLKDQGFQIKATVDCDEAVAYIRQNKGKLTLAIVDFRMPGTDGAQLTKRFSEIDPSLQMATYSGDTTDEAFESAMASGSRYFIHKGMEPNKLLAIIKTFCTRFEEIHRTFAEFPTTDADEKLLASTDHYSKIDGEVQKETSKKVLEHIQKLQRDEQASHLPANVYKLRKIK